MFPNMINKSLIKFLISECMKMEQYQPYIVSYQLNCQDLSCGITIKEGL